MLKTLSALGRILTLALLVSTNTVLATSSFAPRSSRAGPIGAVVLKTSAGRTAALNGSSNSSKTSLKQTQVWVKSGDSLWTLARAHGMSIAQLKKINRLEDEKILLGQKLKVLVRVPRAGVSQAHSSKIVSQKTRSAHARAVAKLGPRAKRLLKIRYTQYLAQQRRTLQVRYAKQARYEKYLALRAKQRRVLQVRYAKQAKFEKYLVLRSKQRHILQVRYALQAKYEKYLALRSSQRRILQAQYAQQAKYERYLALKVQQRRILQARYAQQAKFEKYQAQFQAMRAIALRQQVASRNRLSGSSWVSSSSRAVVRKTSYSGSRLSWPVSNFRLTSNFGRRGIWIEGSNMHTGIDLAAAEGTPIYASSSGTVTQSGNGAFGVNVYVSAGNMDIIYGHMSRTAVNAGEYVNRGDLLGYMGCTGYCTGPHLHFEVRVNGQPRDPMGFMR